MDSRALRGQLPMGVGSNSRRYGGGSGFSWMEGCTACYESITGIMRKLFYSAILDKKPIKGKMERLEKVYRVTVVKTVDRVK
uniref:Uncharacterized protein n=1 Tax=Leersia perrieri TaxID=77586 RepID=A0A0D9XIV7_9ORYZ